MLERKSIVLRTCGAALLAGTLAFASPVHGQAAGESDNAQQASQASPQHRPPPPRRPRGFGLGGVRAKIPHTNGINRTLPIDRKETLLPPPPPSKPRRPDVDRPRPRPRPDWRGRPDWRDRIDWDRHDRRRPRRGVITEGSGIRIDGGFRDDDWKIRFHAGSPFIVPVDPWRSVPYISPFGVFYGYDFDDDHDPIDGYYSAIDPQVLAEYNAAQEMQQAAPTPPPRPMTPLERAEALLRAGDEDGAIEAYREHLRTSSDDAEALRGLALALFEAKEIKEAVAVMAMAYNLDPALATRPLDPSILPDGERSLRRAVSRTSIFANRTHTPAAWLVLAVLMQGENRDEVARRMLERAKNAGLEGPVAERMEAALAV